MQNWKTFLLHLLSGDFAEITKYCLEKLGCSTLQKHAEKERNLGRTQRSGNEKRKMHSIEN